MPDDCRHANILKPQTPKSAQGAAGQSRDRPVTLTHQTPGDSPQGQNLLELMRKNPAVAVPIVLMRMEQKDAEW